MNKEVIAWCLIFSPLFAFGFLAYVHSWQDALKKQRLYDDNDGIIIMSGFTIIGIMFLIGWYLLLLK